VVKYLFFLKSGDISFLIIQVGQPYIHVAVVVYSSTIGEVIPLIPYKSKPVLNMLVANLTQPRFGTDTALGIQKGREILKMQGRRTNTPKVIIVVTDGKSTFPDNTMIQANMAKADGMLIHYAYLYHPIVP
jgi:hypothetical protein